LDREFYVSPQEPTLGIPIARISRLGLRDPFNPTPSSEISWGLPKKPQIGIEAPATITRTGSGASYKIGTGSELEGTKSIGTTITGIERTGVTAIKGQRVDLYKFLTSQAKTTGRILTGKNPFAPSTSATSATFGYSLFSTFLFPLTTGRRTLTTPISTLSTTIIPATTSFLVPPQTRPSMPKISVAPTIPTRG
jgi:hypothetical protein